MTTYPSIRSHKQSTSGRGLPFIAAILLAGLCCSPAAADDSSLTRGARQAGHATGGALHDIGQGAKKVGLTIGHTAAEAGRQIGHGAAKMGRAIGHAAAEGGREFAHAIKGGA